MKTTFTLSFLLITSFLFAQQNMESSDLNFSTFRVLKQEVSPLLIALTPKKYQSHPDFGIKPKNAPKGDFIELIDKRTDSTRYFVSTENTSEIVIQKGYGPIHFRDANHNLREIDFSLFPTTTMGVYKTLLQPNSITIDTIQKTTSLSFGTNTLMFSKNLTLVYENQSHNQTVLAQANWSQFKAGENGFYIKNFFPNIDFYGVVNENQLKTNFVLQSNVTYVFSGGYLIIADQLQGDISSQYMPATTPDIENKFDGDLQIINSGGNNFTIHKGVCFDNSGSNSNTLFYRKTTTQFEMLVNLNWLNNTATSYPVTIDPTISTNGSLAQASCQNSMYNGSCAFTNSCDYNLSVATPANTTITDIQWTFTYATNGNGCKMRDGALKFQYKTCVSPSTAGFYWFCNINSAGSCAGANISMWADFSSCVPAPSCTPYNMNFTMNFFKTCKGTAGCSNDCITSGSPLTITIFGKTLETLTNNATGNGAQNLSVSCLGNTTLNPAQANGVGGYTYVWSPGGQTTNTKTISNFFVGSQLHTCQVTDACGTVRTASFNVTSNCVLPIELLNFDVTPKEERQALLNWSTATETNNDYFEIQHSVNAYNWESLGIIKGAGNTTIKQNYQFTDINPTQGLNYYRLKQVDFDKTFTYSNIVSIDFNGLPESILNLHPNPTKDAVSFDWKATKLGAITIELINGKGQTIYTETKMMDEGISNLTLDVSEYKSGVYLLKVKSEQTGKSSVYKLMKL